MNLTGIFILALALSLDALIVSFSYGLLIDSKRVKNSLILAGFFGFFQFLMPLIGWYLSSFVYSALEIFSKWIVFAVFIVLAMKFLKSAISKSEEVKITCITLMCVFCLALATSIDALGAGISFRFTNCAVIKPSLLIGAVTFIMSFVGFWFACLFRKFPSKYIEITGVILLLYLAVKAII